MITCHHCGSPDQRKNGSYRGVQRYVCKGCGRRFTSRGDRFAKQIKAQALDMYLNNVGMRTMARFVGASPTGVLKWIRIAGERLAEQSRQTADLIADDLPEVIEMDDIYTFVQKNSTGPWSGLLIVGGQAALLPTPSVKESQQL